MDEDVEDDELAHPINQTLARKTCERLWGLENAKYTRLDKLLMDFGYTLTLRQFLALFRGEKPELEKDQSAFLELYRKER